MTQQTPTFNISDFELRDYTNPWLTPAQSTEVAETEDRVNSQLDFLAQMLGWNGPNYWGNLPSTPDQKRQLLGGTFGVYNSYVIPKIYEFRNWDNTIVIDRLEFLSPERTNQIARIVVGEETYQIQSINEEGDKLIVSIGELSDAFFTEIANGTPVQVDIPSFRPAPFYRPNVGVSGDYAFSCANVDGTLTLYPQYDSQKQFPFRFPVLFAGSVYTFDEPVYFSQSSTLSPDITPTYDPDRNVWFFEISSSLASPSGITGYLVWAYTGETESSNIYTEVSIQPWTDPSDWGSENVLNNFRGAWGNKGGDLPFNLVFDSLSIHGVDESRSVFLPSFSSDVDFNNIVNYIYYQKVSVSESAPPGAKIGDVWWNDDTGVFAVFLPNAENCGYWVEIDYRQSLRQRPAPQVVYPDVATFQAQSGSLPIGTIVRITDITGLSVADNVIGVQGTLTTPGSLVLHRETSAVYWTADEFFYANVTDFDTDSQLLPYKVPVTLYSADGLAPVGSNFEIPNLQIRINGNYEVLLIKYYTNTTWEIYPDSILKYIAFSSLYDGLKQGEMWWDFVNPDPKTRFASIYYSSPSPISLLTVRNPGVGLVDGVYPGVNLVTLSGTGGQAKADVTVSGGLVISATVTAGSEGDIYQIGDFVEPNSDLYPELSGSVFEVTGTASQAWVDVNANAQSGPPGSPLNLASLCFYCNGTLMEGGVAYVEDDFTLTYTPNPSTGKYEFFYDPLNFVGRAQLPQITISDSLTTVYRADITDLVFSGITYYLSPNVYNAETPLRLWKAQDLQVAETIEHLDEDNYINPLIADLNNGPGPDNWEKYFIRLPLDYERNGSVWQKVALACQDFAYWGSSVDPEVMECPPEDDLPQIYGELFLYGQPIPDYTYVYAESYLYSNIAYFEGGEVGSYANSGVFPASDVQFDEFTEAELIEYDPLHVRQAFTSLSTIEEEKERVLSLFDSYSGRETPFAIAELLKQIEILDSKTFGDWKGEYVNVNPCVPLTGFLLTDLENRGVELVDPPVWDASIYKYPPTCENAPASYNVDSNHFRIGYAYFVADASAAEDAFFDIQQEAAWRYPVTQPKTLYLTPR